MDVFSFHLSCCSDFNGFGGFGVCVFYVGMAKMMIHLARAALLWGRNARFHHCFSEEDGMCWLKRPSTG